MKLTKDSEVDTTHSTVRDRIPVLDLDTSAPLAGSLALSTPTITPYYANGAQWIPFGSGGALESGMIGIKLGLAEAIADSSYHQVLFYTDMSPLTPPHPSFTIDTLNSQIVINTDGNYLLYYNIAPTNATISSAVQPEQYVAQMATSMPSQFGFDQATGSFQLFGGNLTAPTAVFPAEIASYVKLSGTWSGFLPATTTVITNLAIATDAPTVEILFGEGGRMQYMGIVKLA